ncbi:MAG: tetratricopeptide repeat protein [Lewinellaceae bacterium]|nr:tetratricopeptide repeat protein [Lewinellaceae bacterium]
MAKKPIPRKSVPAAKPAVKTQQKSSNQNSMVDNNWLKPALIALAVTAICYLPSLSNKLVNWDDDANITENPNLQVINRESIANIFDIDKGAVIGNYNPLPIFSFAVEKWFAGDFNTTLIHSTNLLLHLLTVYFAIRVLLLLGIGRWGAFIGGLLFGIHPMRVESVAWATERKDVLFAVFFFAALAYYIRWVKTEDSGKRLRLYLIMLAMAVLSLFSKVQAVTLPLSMLAIDYLLRRPLNFKLIIEKTPFWLLSLAFGLINLTTLRAQGSTDDDVTNFTFVDRLCIGAYSFCVYLYKLVFPYPMSPLYPYPKPLPGIVYAAPIGFLAVTALVIWWMRKDKRWWVFGFLFFFFNVMFLLQVFGAGQGYLADRFTYVPYFGFFAIAAWLYDKYSADAAKRSGLNIAFGILFAIFAIVTFRQIKVWENGETLWTHVIKFEGKTNSLPYWNRGQYYRGLGNFDASMKDYTEAIRISPKNPELYNSRGKTFFDMAMSGKFDQQAGGLVLKAIQDYDAGLALETIKPSTKSELYINRGAAKAASGNLQDAVPDITAGLNLDPKNKNGYFNRSLIYFNLQQFDNAIKDYTSYLEIDPNNVNVWYERGMIKRSLKRNDEAIADLSHAIQLNPQFGIAYLERARAYAQAGNKAAAQQDYQRAAQYQYNMNDYDRQLMAQ